MHSHIEMWPIERLIPYIGNPRKNDHAVDRMIMAIREFGSPVLVPPSSAANA